MIHYFIKKRNPNLFISKKIKSSSLFFFAFKYFKGLLRFLYYRIIFKIYSDGFVFIKSGFKLIGPQIYIGANSIIDENVRIQTLLKSSIKIGTSCRIGYGSDLQTGLMLNDPCGKITFEDNVGIGPFSHIGGAGDVLIRKNTIIGPYFSVHSENHTFSDKNKLYRLQNVTRTGIEVGENCWIGAKVAILDGVVIGNNCVIAAGSVVTKSFDSNVLIGGVPAKIIKKI